MATGETVVMAEGRRMMRLSRQLAPEQFEALLTEFQTLLRELFERAGGREVEVSGDTVTFAFPSARDAAPAAVEAQRAVAAHAWPRGLAIAISVGLDLHPRGCADLCDTAEAGQVFLSPAVAGRLEREDLGDLAVHDLGELRTRRTARQVPARELVFP